jgi:5-oxoprolinase (ATP-hydrolysing)
LKLLSEDPANYESAPREGIRRILEEVTGDAIPRDAPVPTERIEFIRMGTTVATNALLERDGARSALVVTRGFKDLLEIGNQARPDIFDLKIERPSRLYERVLEVDERARVLDTRSRASDREAASAASAAADEDAAGSIPVVVAGVTGEDILVERAIDLEALRPRLQALLDDGIKSLAVVFMHAYAFPNHERAAGDLARSMGFERVSTSSELVPMVKIVPRGHTASVDAYLTPCIRTYLDAFLSGFDDGLKDVNVSFMQSDGGLTPAGSFSGYKAILSGPAGGVVGFARTTSGEADGAPVIGFDMGGTSTDVSRHDGASTGFEQVTEVRSIHWSPYDPVRVVNADP